MKYQNVYVDGAPSDIVVNEGVIESISPAAPDMPRPNLMALPALANMHTHSAMTLLRSAGSGLPLHRWLTEAIFPREAQLSADDIYRGASLACKEMRASGTTAFNDMYFSIESTIKAAQEHHLRGNIALSVVDADFDNGNVMQFEADYQRIADACGNGITISIAPHAIYTVSGMHLRYLAEFAKEHGTLFHMHLSETQKEREDCLRQYGVPPVVYLEQLGVLDLVGSKFVGAHSLWLDDEEIAILGSHHATAVHCPFSNLKLGSGFQFRYVELRDAGVNVALGTDGCASSDNLDLLEAAKLMSLLQKGTRHDPSVMPSWEALQVASVNGCAALGLPDNRLCAGNVADFIMIDINSMPFKEMSFANSTPALIHNELLDRLLYAAHSELIKEVVTP